VKCPEAPAVRAREMSCKVCKMSRNVTNICFENAPPSDSKRGMRVPKNATTTVAVTKVFQTGSAVRCSVP